MITGEQELRTAANAIQLTPAIDLEPRLRIAACATANRPSPLRGGEIHAT
jgi:hypothetical protein